MSRRDKVSRLDIARAMRASQNMAYLTMLPRETKASMVDAVEQAGYRDAAKALANVLGGLHALGLEGNPRGPK